MLLLVHFVPSLEADIIKLRADGHTVHLAYTMQTLGDEMERLRPDATVVQEWMLKHVVNLVVDWRLDITVMTIGELTTKLSSSVHHAVGSSHEEGMK